MEKGAERAQGFRGALSGLVRAWRGFLGAWRFFCGANPDLSIAVSFLRRGCHPEYRPALCVPVCLRSFFARQAATYTFYD